MSSGGIQFMRRLGIPIERVVLTPNVVDNIWWVGKVAQVDRQAVRQRWNIPEDALVVLYCGKLQAWKRPIDLLHAFAQANIENAYLVLAGEGPLRSELEMEVQRLGISEKVRFLGFVNQSQLPPVYRASDVLVLPSAYEAFVLVVNEAMLCGLPAIVSDRVGAKWDLVEDGVTGFVYPCGDVAALARILRDLLSNREKLEKMGRTAQQRIANWSPQKHVDGIVEAVERAIHRPQKRTQ
jgi:glycosyltransferase involved in cell wall biosynthesis